jgi:hypothetical protein
MTARLVFENGKFVIEGNCTLEEAQELIKQTKGFVKKEKKLSVNGQRYGVPEAPQYVKPYIDADGLVVFNAQGFDKRRYTKAQLEMASKSYDAGDIEKTVFEADGKTVKTRFVTVMKGDGSSGKSKVVGENIILLARENGFC